MKRCLWFTLMFTLVLGCTPKTKVYDNFSLHLFQEPLHLDPARQTGSSSNYFFYNTLRGLYRIDETNQLVSEGGECQWKSKLHLICEIKDQNWSDGEPVTANDYIRSFYHLINPTTASPRAYILSSIVNADKIMAGELATDKLGVQILDKKRFEVFFKTPDTEFIYKFTSTALFPRHANHRTDRSDFKSFMINGPYQIQSWDFGREITLSPNPYYKKGSPDRPIVKFYFIDDEMTAYRLYQANKLDFLRRIPSKLISQVKDRDDFHFVPMARFDYLGFGKDIKDNENLRKALAMSVNYEELKQVLHARGRPGCPSIPSNWVDQVPCLEFNVNKAKKLLNRVPKSLQKQKFDFKVSQLGGNDIKKQAEYFQNQWKNNLGVETEIFQVENKVFINHIRENPPSLFRKGVGLDRPTCLNALETFSKDNHRNLIGFHNNKYESYLQKMKTETNPIEYKKHCQNALTLLINNAVVIPLGEIHFSILASPKFSGWTLNSMNQLDLSQLSPVLK